MKNNGPLVGAAILLLLTSLLLLRFRAWPGERRTVKSGSVPPMLERAIRLKVTLLEQATIKYPHRQKQLRRIVSAYQSGKLDINSYHKQLDELLVRWEIDV